MGYYLIKRNIATFLFLMGWIITSWAQRTADLMQQGIENMDRENYKEAIEDFTKVIYVADENQVDALLNRGLCYFRLGQLENAINDFSRAIDRAPDYPAPYFNRGLARLQKGELKAAQRDFTITIDLAPGEVEAYFQRGIVRYQLGDFNAALSDFNTAIQRDSKFTPAYYHRGILYLSIFKYPAAVEDFSTVLKIEPSNGMAYALRGKAKSRLGKYEEALQDLNIALILVPDLAEAFVYRGAVIAALGNIQEAIENFKAARELGFNATELKVEEIRLLWLEQKVDFALSALDSLLLKESSSLDALFLRASIHYAQKNWELATADLNRCIQLNSYHWQAYELLAEVALAQNKVIEAIESLNKAIKLNAIDPELYYKRMQAYRQSGELKKACVDLRKSKELGKTISQEELFSICGSP